MRIRREPTEVGTKIKILLVKKNMTVTELARHLGLRQSTVSDVIYGRNRSKKTIRAIFEIFKECS